MDGVKYANTLHGASDTDTFLQFFAEAAEADTDTGAALTAGDIVIVDNAAIRHHRAKQALSLFLEFIYTPRYSTDFNPVEFAFGYRKTVIRSPDHRDLVHENLAVAIYRATETITAGDTRSFFRPTELVQF